MAMSVDIATGSALDRERLDVALAQLYPDVSRSRIQKWILDGCVSVDGAPSRASQHLRGGQHVSVQPPMAAPAQAWGAEPMALRIIHEDPDVIVVDKPAGLVVHPAAGHPAGTLINGLLARHPSLITLARAGIVHRLDRDTTGLLVVAMHAAAQRALVEQLQNRTVSRQYLALVWGRPSARTIDTTMGRDTRDRQRMSVQTPERGKRAITHITPLADGMLSGQPVRLLICRLETGRTHQIRVHLEHIHHPIVGDRTYCRHAPHASRLGAGHKAIDACIPGQALHAARLEFRSPSSGHVMRFAAAIPEAFEKLLRMAGIAPDTPWPADREGRAA
jgi:23S rRNA pseudouridine1911/1915/1917 synthase